MKIVVIGGTGLIGSKLVSKLREQGHEAVSGSTQHRRQHPYGRRTGRSVERCLGGR